MLRPGGRLVFTEPNILNPQVAFMFHVPFTKRHFGVSPDEMAFGRFHARAVLERARSVAPGLNASLTSPPYKPR